MKQGKKDSKKGGKKISRREFLGTAAFATAAATVVPRHVMGGQGYTPPSDKVNLAIIGVGGQGTIHLNQFLEMDDVQIVSVCDVNELCDYKKFYFGGVAGWGPAKNLVNETYANQKNAGSYNGCSAFVDFRDMLEKESGIDAVVVATTDNNHAIASMAAIKKGKHVYCEKPLTHDIYEARMLTLAARKQGVATQMGNQGRSMEGNRLVREWIQDGAIGDVHEVHVWTNRPFGYWPQGVSRPATIPSVPRELNWNLWLGPAAFRPYHPTYVPFNWRGFWDFGTGALGDMGCHLMDTPVWALDLGQPNSVEASCTPVNDETAPVGSIIHYDFPARGSMPEVRMSWYDGGLLPPRPVELEEGRRISKDGGILFVGNKGKLLCSTYGDNPRLIPETEMRAYKRPEKTIPRVEGIREDWIQACKGGTPACSNFDVSGPLTEIVLLGNLAVRANGRRLNWDGEKMEVTNYDPANQYVRRQYYGGWKL